MATPKKPEMIDLCDDDDEDEDDRSSSSEEEDEEEEEDLLSPVSKSQVALITKGVKRPLEEDEEADQDEPDDDDDEETRFDEESKDADPTPEEVQELIRKAEERAVEQEANLPLTKAINLNYLNKRTDPATKPRPKPKQWPEITFDRLKFEDQTALPPQGVVYMYHGDRRRPFSIRKSEALEQEKTLLLRVCRLHTQETAAAAEKNEPERELPTPEEAEKMDDDALLKAFGVRFALFESDKYEVIYNTLLNVVTEALCTDRDWSQRYTVEADEYADAWCKDNAYDSTINIDTGDQQEEPWFVLSVRKRSEEDNLLTLRFYHNAMTMTMHEHRASVDIPLERAVCNGLPWSATRRQEDQELKKRKVSSSGAGASSSSSSSSSM